MDPSVTPPPGEFITEDLQLAAFLDALGFTPRLAGPAQRRQFIFVGSVSPRVADYYQTPCACSAKELFRHYRLLRSRMFAKTDSLH